jgi:cytochrome P450
VTAAPSSPHADLDFTEPGFLDDPYPALARLRETAPVLWHEPTGQWLAVSYSAANSVLRDRRFGRLWTDKTPVDQMEPFNRLHRNQMMENEPPTHTRLRSLVAKAFARGHVERLRPRVQAIADGLLDAVDPARFDLLADYAEPLPVAVIADLLGVQESDRSLLRPWSAGIVAMYEYGRTDETAAHAVTAAAEFSAYMKELAEARRRDPRDDMVSHLVAAEEDGQRLTSDELVASAVLLLNAGHEASVNGAGNGWWTLFRHPAALAELRAEPAMAATAIDELLRFDTPLPLFERWVLEPIEVDGVRIPRGAEVALLFISANRDPDAFGRPDELDLRRRPNPSVSFGAGIHYCLGAPLARLELSIAFETLLRRLPRMEPVGEPAWKPTFVLRGLEALQVRA